MTGSIAPPPASPRAFLRSATRGSQVVAALLVAAVSVRFAVAGVLHALSVSNVNFADKPAPHASGAPPPADSGENGSPDRIPRKGAGAEGKTESNGKSVRLTLSVSSGSPRSEVYVNGARVGNAPFLGDTSCKLGQPIRIEVVPASGPPLTYARTCHAGSIEISGPPP